MSNSGVMYTNVSLEFAELFLSPSEKQSFTEWKEVVEDKSFINRMLDPIFTWISGFLPDRVAPNVITFVGLLAIVQNWCFVLQYNQDLPRFCSYSTIIAIVIYWITHGLDAKHARRLMNDTPLGEYFKYVCDNIILVFLVAAVTTLFNPNDLEIQWIAVHTAQLVLMFKHFSAFVRDAGMRYWFFGPGEVVTLTVYLIFLRATFGLDWFMSNYLICYSFVLEKVVQVLGLKEILISEQYSWITSSQPDPGELMKDMCVSIYCLTFLCILFALLVRREHGFTRGSMMFILFYRMIPTFFRFLSSYILTRFEDNSPGPSTKSIFSQSTLLNLQAIPKNELSHEGIILDGLFMCVVTSDIVLAKMARRELHVWVTIMCFSHAMPYTQFITACLIAFYYIAVLGDLCWYMNLPLLAAARNVYCDGVFDLCHIGHKNLFRAALKHGNRLFVGVCGDADCAAYKRPPIMSHKERCDEIMGCKAVTKVIPNAPTFGLTKDFLKKHRIHIVCCGEEYVERYPDPKDDPYYGLPRKMGIARPLPRTMSLSTSDLIRRIQDMPSADDRKDGGGALKQLEQIEKIAKESGQRRLRSPDSTDRDKDKNQ